MALLCSNPVSSLPFLGSDVPPEVQYIHTQDLDIETAILIAQLAQEDIEQVLSTRKGKARETSPLSDTELACQMQLEIFQQAVVFSEDAVLARSIDAAVAADAACLDAFSVVEQAACADRRAAEMLARGERLPARTEAQSRVADPDFRMEPVIPGVPVDDSLAPDTKHGAECSNSKAVDVNHTVDKALNPLPKQEDDSPSRKCKYKHNIVDLKPAFPFICDGCGISLINCTIDKQEETQVLEKDRLYCYFCHTFLGCAVKLSPHKSSEVGLLVDHIRRRVARASGAWGGKKRARRSPSMSLTERRESRLSMVTDIESS
ncbi:hypothetical protein JR316_0010660 [Psilocybe cubensis]|uniref:Uncharacterized protein n=2 Tax=Psilocybe cubensis TaxID=181762 RepID=A0A8H7XV23_PSICU|nr:hypothetical protein JR316_0010660 [Psilocybe cubensis]KAH9476745.1 hypothetical protein JR316_0010660 [Psilocybe cubensis]